MKNKSVITLIVVILITIVIVGAVIISKKGKNNNSSVNENLSNNSTTTTKKDELIYNDTKNFEYAEVDGGIAITKFKNYDNVKYNKIIIPSQIDGKTVISIGRRFTDDRAMSVVTDECEVVIPSTVIAIGPWAFSNAKGITKISGGENVKTIYGKAFYKCENLSEVSFLSNVNWFSDNSFTNTPLDQTAKKIRKDSNMVNSLELDETFDHYKINNKIGPYEYKEIEGGIAITYFYNAGNNNYSKITIPSELDGKKVVGIGMTDGTSPMCFNVGDQKCEIVIPDTVKYIGKLAFAATEGLEKLSGGKNVSKIYEQAFDSCINLKEVTFIKNVKSVDDSAFDGCTAWNAKH